MRLLNCLLVDDEPSALALLRNFVERTPFLHLQNSTTNPIEALRLLQEQPTDLLFLDVQMPQLSGLQLLRLLPSHTQVILTTAYSEFAVLGFELNVLDYLLKPFSFERFLQAGQKALTTTAPPAPPLAVADQEYWFVKTEGKGRLVRVAFKDIMYVEGHKNYVLIQTLTEQVRTLLTLKDVEAQLLPPRFLRVHKSYLMAMDKLRAVDGAQLLLTGTQGYVPLGETYRAGFFEQISAYLPTGQR